MATDRVTVTLMTDERQQLRALATEDCTSESSLARRAIKHWLALQRAQRLQDERDGKDAA
jgi:hypothetical protein